MALTTSKMMQRNTQAPYFSLPNCLDDKKVSFSSADLGFPALVMFICNHCPYVKHIKSEIAKVSSEAISLGFKVFAINSNDVANYPDDHPNKMKEDAKNFGYQFPYLFDEDQSVAKSFDAVCTPEFYVFNKNHKLEYCGQFDSSRPKNNLEVNGSDLRTAINLVGKGLPAPEKQIPSIGCNIKWTS